MRNTLAVLSVIAICLASGCAPSPPQPAADQTAADSNDTADVHDGAAPESNVQEGVTPEAEPAAEVAGGGLTGQAFVAANERVLKIMEEIIKTLDGVTDEASGQAAAPRLAELTPQWKSAATAATAAYVVLDDDEGDRIYSEAMRTYQSKSVNVQLTHGRDLIKQIQRVAKVGGPAIQQELTAFRDAFLTTRGIYSPTRARERMAEKLGAQGSPLVTE